MMFSIWHNWFILCWMSNHWYCTACRTSTPRPLCVVASEATRVSVYMIYLRDLFSWLLDCQWEPILRCNKSTEVEKDWFSSLTLSNVHIPTKCACACARPTRVGVVKIFARALSLATPLAKFLDQRLSLQQLYIANNLALLLCSIIQ